MNNKRNLTALFLTSILLTGCANEDENGLNEKNFTDTQASMFLYNIITKKCADITKVKLADIFEIASTIANPQARMSKEDCIAKLRGASWPSFAEIEALKKSEPA